MWGPLSNIWLGSMLRVNDELVTRKYNFEANIVYEQFSSYFPIVLYQSDNAILN